MFFLCNCSTTGAQINVLISLALGDMNCVFAHCKYTASTWKVRKVLARPRTSLHQLSGEMVP